jgi:hypothetical protein
MLSQFADFSRYQKMLLSLQQWKGGECAPRRKERADQPCTPVRSAVGPWMDGYWLPRRIRTLLESEEGDLTAVRTGYFGETTGFSV